MKKLITILSVVLFANQASADDIRVGDVYYCSEDTSFLATAAPSAKIVEYERTGFKFVVNEGNITFGKEGALAGEVFGIDQPYNRTLRNGHYTNLIFAKKRENNNLMLSSQENGSLKLIYTLFGLEGQIIGSIASCDKF